MLEKIDLIPLDTMNLVIYVRSEVVKAIIKDTLKQRFDIPRNVHLVARTAKELKDIKHDTITQPFGGGKWFVEVETDEISIKEIKKAVISTYNTSLTIYWVSNYGLYKKIVDLAELKRQGVYSQVFYFGRLDSNDIYYLQMKIVQDKELYLKDNLMKYLIKNYTYDVDAVCDLFISIKNGSKVKTKNDIIKLVGLGGNTVDSYVIKLLTYNPRTEKGLNKIVSDSLALLTDLSQNYDYITIKNYMISAINAMIEIKQLQIQGLFSMVKQDIPEGYNEYKIKRLRRFYRTILEEIPLARLLNLKLCLEQEDMYNAELGLLHSTMTYLNGVKESFEKHPEKEIDTKYRRGKRK